jgi:lysophospholipase L1-like esterase
MAKPSTLGETMRQLTKRLAFSAVATALVLGCLNGLAALISPKSSVFWQNPLMVMYPVDSFDEKVDKERFNRDDSPMRSVRYVPDSHRWYRLDPEPDIPETGKLILNFGDSSTYGWGLGNRDQAYAGDLNELVPGVTSVNLGVPGYSSLQGLRYVQKVIPRYHDRIVGVTLYFGNNDSTENGSEDDAKLAVVTRWPTLLRQHFALFRVMQDAMPRKAGHNRSPRVSPEVYLANMRDMVVITRGYGIPVAVVAPPLNRSWPPGYRTYTNSLDPYVNNEWTARELALAQRLHQDGLRLWEESDDRAHDLLGASVEHDWIVPRLKARWADQLDVLQQEGVSVARLDQHFIGAEFPYMFVDYCHPSAKTHRQIAERIVEGLSMQP